MGRSSLDPHDCIHSRSDSGYWAHGCQSDSSRAVHPIWSFLAFGACLTLFFQAELINWYFGLI